MPTINQASCRVSTVIFMHAHDYVVFNKTKKVLGGSSNDRKIGFRIIESSVMIFVVNISYTMKHLELIIKQNVLGSILMTILYLIKSSCICSVKVIIKLCLHVLINIKVCD